MDFKKDLSQDLLKGIKTLGYKEPTGVQQLVFEPIKEKRDVVVKAKTGSGKTGAFSMPIIDDIKVEASNPKVLVLTPTRELAVQVSEEMAAIGRYKKIRAIAVYGKQSITAQINQLKQRVHVVVGTPGRVNDLIRRGDLKLSDVDYFVMDEADELLRRGFLDDIKECFRKLPDSAQGLMFSATIPDDISRLIRDFMDDPVMIETYEEPPKIKEIMVELGEKEKFSLLLKVLNEYKPFNCMVFCNTKVQVDSVFARMKSAGLKPLKLHGGMNQRERLRSIDKFKNGDAMCLIATDLAARGIHVNSLDMVVNFYVPLIAENYTHRIGRTGRKDEEGLAITFVAEEESVELKEVEKHRKCSIPLLSVSEFLGVDEPVKYVKVDQSVEKMRHEKRAADKGVQTEHVQKDIAHLRINIGKNKKVRNIDVLGAVSNIDGVSGDDVGIIEVRDTCTYVDIHNHKGGMVLKNLKRVKGKNVKTVVIKKRKR